MVDAPKPTLEPNVTVVDIIRSNMYLLVQDCRCKFGWDVGFRAIYLSNVLVRISVFTSQVQIGL